MPLEGLCYANTLCSVTSSFFLYQKGMDWPNLPPSCIPGLIHILGNLLLIGLGIFFFVSEVVVVSFFLSFFTNEVEYIFLYGCAWTVSVETF